MNQLIADENIPLETVDLLKKRGIDIVTLPELLRGTSDRNLLVTAKAKERILVTFDHDFGQLIFKEKLETHGVMLLLFAPKSPQQIAKRIQQALSAKVTMTNMVVTVREDRIKVTRAK